MKSYFLIFLIVTSSILVAQNRFSLSGYVVSENGELIEVGDALLFSKNGSELLAYTTLLKGEFSFEDLLEGEYRLKINALGFMPIEQEIHLKNNKKLQLVLRENINILDEVAVTALKNPIEYKNGNLKINVQNPVFNAIPDPLDVLGKLPNLQIAPDRESISVLGRGTPLIYIGNQRVQFEEFSTLSVDEIESIELINNPSSKYEADGRAVLLVTLKSEKSGERLAASETLSMRRNFNNYLGVNGSFSRGKWSVRANLAYNDLQRWESNGFAFEISERNIFTDYVVLVAEDNRDQINTALGVYHQLKGDDYISLNITSRLQSDDAPFLGNTFVRDNMVESDIVSRSENQQTKDYFSSAFNFNKKLSKASNAFMGAQYSLFEQTLDSDISNNYNATAFINEEMRDQEYRIEALAFRADLNTQIEENIKLEYGANTNFAWAKTTGITTDLITEAINEAQFDYNEKMLAGYVALNGKKDAKWTYNMGLRVERNEAEVKQKGFELPIVQRENTNFFPKAKFNLTIDSTKTLTLNYARSIRRPDFSRLNAIQTFINPYLEGANNINLRPTLTQDLSLNAQWKKQSFEVGAYQNNHPIFWTISYDEVQNVGILSQVNLKKETGFYATINLPFTNKNWTSNTSISSYWNKIEDADTNTGTSKPFLYVYTNHQFKIAPNTTFALGGWAITKSKQGVIERNEIVVLDVSIHHTFFKKLQCTLRFNDIPRMNYEERYSIGAVNANGTYFSDGRELAFSIKYQFSKGEKDTFKNKDIDDNLNRIK